MPRKHRNVRQSGHTVILTDDDAAYLEATRMLLEAEGHEVLCASSGLEALELLQQSRADLLLLDYFMPGMTGEEVVTELRKFNPHIQVVLQTGYSNEQPPREMLRRLDIQGYYDKSEGPEKLLLWTDAGLKAATTLQRLHRSRQGLQYILEVTPDLHKMQPLVDLLQGILTQVTGLMGAVSSFLAVVPEAGASPRTEGFLAMLREDSELVIRASMGRFSGCETLESALAESEVQEVLETLARGEIHVSATATVLPLHVGELTLGVIYLDCAVLAQQDVALLEIFANQATVAIQNMQLYEMAALDPLTGVHARRFFEQWMRREVRTAFRARRPVSLIMVDMDNLKRINDTSGHLVGDQALAMLGKALRGATRENDVVGRFGGDEFSIILPQTNSEGATRVADRVIESLTELSLPSPRGPMPLRCSLGQATMATHPFDCSRLRRSVPHSYFEDVAKDLMRFADDALYLAKAAGGARVHRVSEVPWAPLPQTPEARPPIHPTGEPLDGAPSAARDPTPAANKG